jgi:hypothetical protein
MAMTRHEALVAAAAGGLAMTGMASAAENLPAPDEASRLTEGDRRRLEEAGPVTVKVFVAALRRRFSDAEAGALRKFIDPRYLKEHGLQDGAFSIERVVTGAIDHNELSDDPRTALNVAQTEGGAKECSLFRLTVRDGKVYIRPLSPPDKESKRFHPWILRVKLQG